MLFHHLLLELGILLSSPFFKMYIVSELLSRLGANAPTILAIVQISLRRRPLLALLCLLPQPLLMRLTIARIVPLLPVHSRRLIILEQRQSPRLVPGQPIFVFLLWPFQFRAVKPQLLSAAFAQRHVAFGVHASVHGSLYLLDEASVLRLYHLLEAASDDPAVRLLRKPLLLQLDLVANTWLQLLLLAVVFVDYLVLNAA